MRKREEINKDIIHYSEINGVFEDYQFKRLLLEALLDIRELLEKPPRENIGNKSGGSFGTSG